MPRRNISVRREYKSLQSDRVILIPGPDEEIKNVRWIYRAFVDEGKQEGEIAAELNNRGVLTDFNRPWTRGTVHQVLTNEKYIGHNVFNRTSFKLKMRHMNNPPDMWIRREGAFEGIVDPRCLSAGRVRQSFIGAGRIRLARPDDSLSRSGGIALQKP